MTRFLHVSLVSKVSFLDQINIQIHGEMYLELEVNDVKMKTVPFCLSIHSICFLLTDLMYHAVTRGTAIHGKTLDVRTFTACLQLWDMSTEC